MKIDLIKNKNVLIAIKPELHNSLWILACVKPCGWRKRYASRRKSVVCARSKVSKFLIPPALDKPYNLGHESQKVVRSPDEFLQEIKPKLVALSSQTKHTKCLLWWMETFLSASLQPSYSPLINDLDLPSLRLKVPHLYKQILGRPFQVIKSITRSKPILDYVGRL